MNPEEVSELFPLGSSSFHIFFRKKGGEIGFSGDNNYGPLGTGSSLDVIDIQTKKEIRGLKTSEIKTIVSNWFVFFLLTTKGEVFSTGTEGYSGHSENKLQFTQLRFPEEKEILNISCSLYYTVFLTSQGHIYYCVEWNVQQHSEFNPQKRSLWFRFSSFPAHNSRSQR